MKLLFVISVSIIFLSKGVAQTHEPYAYFGYKGLDSLTTNQLLELDTLKMNNPIFKIEKFMIALSSIYPEINDISLFEIKGNALSNNKIFYEGLKKGKDRFHLTIMDIDFINSKGVLVHYEKEFSFLILCAIILLNNKSTVQGSDTTKLNSNSVDDNIKIILT